MKLKQRFLTQSILILIGTIVITGCMGFSYVYFYNMLNESQITRGVGKTAVVVIEDDNIVYNSEDFTMLQIKEMLMNLSVDNDKYEYENKKYSLNQENFFMQDGVNCRVITLNEIIYAGAYYRSFIIFVFMCFIIIFVIANIIVQKQNLKNIIIPVTDLKKETEKLRLGELETAITEKGYGEVRELGTAVEQLRIQLKNSIYYQQRVDENRKFLISSISHDLKTPVTSIRGYIDGVLDGVADTDEKKRYYLSNAIEKTKMINTMIEDLLLYSRLDLNQMTFEKDRTDIIKYMESCIEECSEEFNRENKHIFFENNLTASYFVLIDAAKFKRVVQNILDNAKRNIEKHSGQLKIILRETNSSVIIEFNDNGKGISENDLPHIFDRFYRADTAREVKGSSGLGLAIAKQIVEGLGGRIWAVSEIGHGASIIISLKKINSQEVIK